ncbi:hypothetical protein PWT90_03281 [Aphanocladium album]|nr:hypothetical protein PWT90_03281 [Aphanocladium album]
MVSPEILGLDLIDQLAAHLSISELGSLRLSGRALASQVSFSQHYVRHFKTKTVQFSVVDLHRFNEATQANGLCCLLQHLSLNCAVEMRTMDGEELAQMQRLLILAFGNIVRHSSTHAIASLRLTTMPGRSSIDTRSDAYGRSVRRPHELCTYGSWRCVWVAAASLFTAATAALHTSRLLVLGELDLFSKSAGALGYDLFTGVPREFSSPGPFERLSSLKARFSAPIGARPWHIMHEHDVGREEAHRRL